MYLELALFAAFVYFAYLDVRYRQIKAYWIALLAVFVISYKLIFEFDHFVSDGFLFLVSSIFVGIAYACRLLAAADMLAILILSFAIPSFGPIPSGLPLLILTLLLQNWAIIISNTSYNISDSAKNFPLFDEMPNIRDGRLRRIRKLYWFFLARRRRKNDRFVLSAERLDENGTAWLAVKRGNNLRDNTRYVFSAHPQFVYSTASFFMLYFSIPSTI